MIETVAPLFTPLIVVVAFLCVIDLRIGMFLTLAIGFLQDPLRKIVPDAPVYYSTLVILFAGLTFLGAMQGSVMRPFGAIPEWNSRLKTPIVLFIGLVLVQSFATFLYSGSVFLAGIGLLVYLAPFPALQLGHSFASNRGRVNQFLWLYVVLSAVMASGVYLSWFGYDWEVLQSVGEPLIVYSLETGEPLVLPSGFMRTPEVAAWHAASGACVVVMLAMSRKRMGIGLLSAALVMFFAGVVMLTGRRKFLLEIVMFFPIMSWLLWRFRMETGRLLYLLCAIAVAGVVVMATGILDSDTREAFEAPVSRGEDRTGEILERIEILTFGAVPYILQTNGVLGAGAGTGSGGSQYYGGGDDFVGASAEGGLGKVLAEMGIPGLLLFFWLAFRFSAYMWRTLAAVAKADPEVARLTLGIATFLAANVIVFTSAHQVYSDPFILLIIGSCIGFVLATYRMVAANRSMGGRQILRGTQESRRGFQSIR